MPRSIQLHDWVKSVFTHQFPGQDWQIEPASADASFRRYFRVTLPDGTTRIVMDAPPEHEDCRPFLKVAALLHEAGVHVPVVHAEDLAQGFLLLSDLGNTTYLSALDAKTAPRLYRDANIALVAIQRASRPGVLPEYDRSLLEHELQLFPDWYVARHLGVTLDETQQATLRTVFDKILANNLAQPQVFVHRDYHSRNLMVSGEDFPDNPGILDFQDAVFGPITYDLASLYRDAYIHWEEDQELDFVIRYWEMARKAGLPVHADFHDFYRDYEWMGAQRQLKVLGIFARLCHRDGKDGYLKDMPTVMAYLRQTCERYLDLRPLARLFDQLENKQPEVGYTF
jgi:aminoglycoside/choline kinase family phosphotransferase